MIKKGEIIIKNTQVLRALMERRYDPNLITIECEIADNFGAYITEGWREARHKGDVHATLPGRGVDNRIRVYGSLEKAYEIENWINRRWEYDFKRAEMKVAYIHGEGDNKHLHLQTHPRPTRRTGRR